MRPTCCAAPVAKDGKVKNETLANLSHLPKETIQLIRESLAGQRLGKLLGYPV